ncbi:type II toxin-antitoxin system antitoxin SocA domain-containing protein [uncultured Parvimonas sp.]|uniref:Panacea domain-containing protein n=1 Tax=uncultured Parvimonas sp. TaxID=747372 RepID=UPI0028D87BF6|nr:type II toxin-antitoxin system antitoxin SocA domain-containing protein [uncultured Parvimonas sp.]
MKKSYCALEISKYIIDKCEKDNYPISNLQLQKILYFVQRKFLKDFDFALFDDDIVAWQFGPVVPSVYYQYCGFGSTEITMEYDNISICPEDKNIIYKIVCEKREKAPWDLVEETHSKGKAWDVVYDSGKGNGKVIPIDLIKQIG